MELPQSKDCSIILRDVHCPYCETDKALLISRKTTSTIGLRYPPAFGLRFILSLVYLTILQVFRNGMKILEVTKGIVYSTYVFCPNCGNSYSAGPPEEVKAEVNDPVFYRIRKGKSISGLCKGISEYTDISLLWVRIMTVLYGLTIIGAILYFLIAVCIPIKEDVESGVWEDRKFRRATKNEGGVFIGLCKGISIHTDVSVVWLRILAVLFGLIVVLFIIGIVGIIRIFSFLPFM
jgi:phage shock protein PspC (stress-responsive transcriptional regulator)